MKQLVKKFGYRHIEDEMNQYIKDGWAIKQMTGISSLGDVSVLVLFEKK